LVGCLHDDTRELRALLPGRGQLALGCADRGQPIWPARVGAGHDVHPPRVYCCHGDRHLVQLEHDGHDEVLDREPPVRVFEQQLLLASFLDVRDQAPTCHPSGPE
jgi:hypothetical protein